MFSVQRTLYFVGFYYQVLHVYGIATESKKMLCIISYGTLLNLNSGEVNFDFHNFEVDKIKFQSNT